MSVLYRTTLASAIVALSVTAAIATDKRPADEARAPVIAKLLVLPGGDALGDINSAARDVSLNGAFNEGSSSHNNQNDQNGKTDILDDSGLGKAALGVSKPKIRAKVKRKAAKTKTRRVKVARISIPRKTVKRRAPLMMGVYR